MTSIFFILFFGGGASATLELCTDSRQMWHAVGLPVHMVEVKIILLEICQAGLSGLQNLICCMMTVANFGHKEQVLTPHIAGGIQHLQPLA